MLDAKISDFVMLITFVKVAAASLHKLSNSTDLVEAEIAQSEMLEFKVCT